MEKDYRLMQVYTINDKLAQECGPVFESVNHATALRSYRRMLEKEHYAPEEYQLLHIGSINHSDASFTVNPLPRVICDADATEVLDA